MGYASSVLGPAKGGSALANAVEGPAPIPGFPSRPNAKRWLPAFRP